MKGYLLKERIILLTLQTLSCVLLVLSCDVSRDTWYTALSLLSALKDDLHPVTFCFLCHNS